MCSFLVSRGPNSKIKSILVTNNHGRGARKLKNAEDVQVSCISARKMTSRITATQLDGEAGLLKKSVQGHSGVTRNK
ncbi:hypothetical protein NQ314_015006 [Rhamnusium bicolor]|uniref:Ribosomal protein L28 n=1 Tax=Rhamnusium bicolor TaxID=1586634 RepID=A0AAV8WZ86_9CUCU|nr:hypothetical protein NQ314_015006 [Rhamnusium bicolor]